MMKLNSKALALVLLLLGVFVLWYTQREPSIGAERMAEAWRSGIFNTDYRVLSLPPAQPPLRVTTPVADRQAFFGDLHVHTTLSFDGFSMGTIATPADAYRYARGEVLKHPAGFDMQLRQPLDFYAVTDHAMFMGVARAAADTSTRYSSYGPSQKVHGLNDPGNQGTDLISAARRVGAFADFLSDNVGAIQAGEIPVEEAQAIMSESWREVIDAARQFNEPGRFTTLVGYEYTAMASDAGNLHRNVIFRDAENLPLQPFSTMHSENPEDLWDWMDAMRANGVDSMAIPHNSNGSNGHMFALTRTDGSPMDADYVAQRMRNEPLVEITQIKGTSETHPLLSTRDEWANFEITNQRVASSLLSEPDGSYVRQALQRGLLLEKQGVGNPFDFGLIGSSDTHNAASGVDEDNYVSKLGLLSADGKTRGSVPYAWWEGLLINLGSSGLAEYVDGKPYISGSVPTFGAAGLAGVWAEANTREHIYEALRRRETFATTGPRMRLRFFAGTDFDAAMTTAPDAVAQAYQRGTTMGGTLSVNAKQQPVFWLWASADPDSTPLQRAQIVKGWISDDGELHEAVYDVACAGGVAVDPLTHRCPDNGATVDLATCENSADTGSAQLQTLWRDPDYRVGQRAFYYARVLENPSCRWSTWDAIRAGVEPRPDLAATIQERVWSSPIQVR